MGIVVSVFLIAVGAIMRIAVSAQGQVWNVHTTGVVLLIVGGIGAVTVKKNVLTVKAERRWPAVGTDEIVIQERPQGQFSRQIFLGDALDTTRLTAGSSDGVLTIMLPVAKAAKPRKVTISTGAAAAHKPAA